MTDPGFVGGYPGSAALSGVPWVNLMANQGMMGGGVLGPGNSGYPALPSIRGPLSLGGVTATPTVAAPTYQDSAGHAAGNQGAGAQSQPNQWPALVNWLMGKLGIQNGNNPLFTLPSMAQSGGAANAFNALAPLLRIGGGVGNSSPSGNPFGNSPAGGLYGG
jgi:hypothetical protein